MQTVQLCVKNFLEAVTLYYQHYKFTIQPISKPFQSQQTSDIIFPSMC